MLAALPIGVVVASYEKCGQSTAVAEAYLPTKWQLDPSSRLATIDMRRKLGVCPLFGELGPHLTQSRLGRCLPPYPVAS